MQTKGCRSEEVFSNELRNNFFRRDCTSIQMTTNVHFEHATLIPESSFTNSCMSVTACDFKSKTTRFLSVGDVQE